MIKSQPYVVALGATTGSFLLFTIHDAIIKVLAADVSLWLIMFVRSAVIVLFCIAIGRRNLLALTARSGMKHLHVLRGAVLVVAWYSYYTAATRLQLAELTTIYFVVPLITSVFAALFLKEKVGAYRWAATTIGFSGVVVACNPGGISDFTAAGLTLLSAALWSWSSILVRGRAQTESVLVFALYANAVFASASLCMLPFSSLDAPPEAFRWMIIVGMLSALAQIAFFYALRLAPASLVAPAQYTQLLWATAIGYLYWGDVPSHSVIAGAALIIGSGMLLFWRERVRSTEVEERNARSA